MKKVSSVLVQSGDLLGFDCPGCGRKHFLNVVPDCKPCWGFNGNYENPTFTPSILWRRGDKPGDPRCHSFVTNGEIRFLNDCTHDLAGQTVPLPEVSE